jgi:8-oxo-dGTP diphosphatase
METRPEIHVMAGVLSDGQGRVLIAQRPVGKHMAGRWEFPGGKLAADEAPLAGLQREFLEELGVTVRLAEPLIRLRHDYSDRQVLLDVWQVKEFSGEPRGLDSQAIQWVAPHDLPGIDLLEADRPIITALRLPRVARCIAGAEALAAAAGAVRSEALFWWPKDSAAASREIHEQVQALRRAGHLLIVTGAGAEAAALAASCGADGLLLESVDPMLSIDAGGAFVVGAICATAAVATAAAAAGAHFVVLVPGPEGTEPRELARLVQRLGLPAYLGWYPDAGSLELARASGAHGCAIGPAAGTAGRPGA